MAYEKTDKDLATNHRHPDAITGAPGSHPDGTGIGAAAGGLTGAGVAAAAAGAVTGTFIAGPVGTALGIIAGAVVGGVAGHAIGEKHDPTVDDAYWRDEYANRPYYNKEHDYDRDVAPAYRYGGTVGQSVNDTYPDATYRDAAPVNREGGGVVEATKEGVKNVGHKIADTGRSLKDRAADAFSTSVDTDDAIARRDYATHEDEIRSNWEQARGESRLSYDGARHAIRDAYDRRVTREPGVGTGPSGTNPTGM